jgi:glucan 1,3-beta-glucosidase
MLRSLSLFALVAGAIVFAWYRLGQPVPMPPSPLGAGEKLTCISYAPFHDDQAPFALNLFIPDAQIKGDLAELSQAVSCVRTYSARGPQGRVPRFAAAEGLKVLQGIWLGRNRAENRREIEAALRLSRRYPGTIAALIVGNETLLRGELPPAEIKAYLEEVKRRSGLPVTYADVWEFWLKAPEIAAATDFLTIHILPYWEDRPVSIDAALAHVREVREKVKAAFPGKDILIGETGWPSRGRMRAAALPSPANQARYLGEVMAVAKQEGWKVNLIEAYDQPWKRVLEGTVGGYWGLYNDAGGAPKFTFGEAVSNHPDWAVKAGLGVGAALLVFVSFWLGLRRDESARRSRGRDFACAGIALGAGLLFGLAAVNLPIEGEIVADRLRAAFMLVLALAVPMSASYALARGDKLSGFAAALDPPSRRGSGIVAVVLAALLAATVVAAIHVALGLVFDPRYQDFPVASLLGPVVALFILAFSAAKDAVRAGSAELAAGAVLAGSAIVITIDEGSANWQAVSLALLLVLLALTCLRARPAPG